jgi:hypothetical protein
LSAIIPVNITCCGDGPMFAASRLSLLDESVRCVQTLLHPNQLCRLATVKDLVRVQQNVHRNVQEKLGIPGKVCPKFSI